MKHYAIASLVFALSAPAWSAPWSAPWSAGSLPAGPQAAGLPQRVLTFEEAVSLASKKSGEPPLIDAASLRGARLPNVRVEVAANTSRTLDLFTEGPYEVRYATSVLAFDYPLWDGGAMRARIDSLVARDQRRQRALDDARYARLLDAFGELYIAQTHHQIIRPMYEQLSAEASPTLVESGEISNLTAADRRETMLSFEGRLFDLEVRRLDAAARLRSLTGLEDEPLVELTLEQQAPAAPPSDGTIHDDVVEAAGIAVRESEARLFEVTATSGFRAMLSGFAGIGAAESEVRDQSDGGSYGIYGLRINLSYPLIRGSSVVPLTEARVDLARAQRAHELALEAARARLAEYELREESSRKRIELLRAGIETSIAREESLQRLVSAGVRPEMELAHARTERVRRELDLTTARVEQWKLSRMLERMLHGTPDSP